MVRRNSDYMSEQGVELLRSLLQYTSKKKTVRAKSKCSICGSSGRLDRHHITYKPAKIARICRACHANITTVNSIAAVVLKRRLTNGTRIRLWNWFTKFQGAFTEHDVAEVLRVNHTFSVDDYERIKSRRRI